jgi:DNA polymerase III subunit delta
MIIFLYGEDTFRSRQKLKELKDKFLREVDKSGNSLVILEGENITINKINESISTSSLFVRKRMVVIERILGNKSKILLDQVLEYLKNNFNSEKIKNEVDENIIIFRDEIAQEKGAKIKLFDFLKKQKFTYEFKPLSNTETAGWIKKEFEARGAKIKPSASVALAGLVGNDLWQLNNEIDKMINYKIGQKSGGETVIEETDLINMVNAKFNENIFALTDAISNKNKALASMLLEKELESGIAEVNLMHMISRQFRILLLVRQCLDKFYDSRKTASVLKLHPFVVQKSLTQVRSFTVLVLKNILNELIEIDSKIKSGRVDARTALTLLLAKI